MSNPLQLELPARADTPLFLIKQDHPNVTWLISLLRARGWHTRNQILAESRKASTEYSDRWVRALVQAAGPVIVKGQEGFNHIDNCTLEQINHAANQSISQGKIMIKYGIALRRAVHQRTA